MQRAATEPRMSWDLTSAQRTPHLGPVLRVGARAVPVREIVGFVASSDLEADKKPVFATLAVFGIATVFFLIGVLDIGWRTRFLLASVLFGTIALSALHDLTWLTTSGIHRVEIKLASGDVVRFATVDPAQQEALLAALERVVARAQPAANDDGLAAA